MDTNENTRPAGGRRTGRAPAPVDAPGTNTDPRPPTAVGTVANVVRGGLIGLAETIPGVSGGTVALVTGIYPRLIASAKNITEIPKAMVTKGDWRAAARKVDWWLLLPVAFGMVAIVFSLAGIMESFVTGQPVASKALFMGMIAASVIVPFQEIRPGALERPGMRGKAIATFVLFAVGTFWLTSLPQASGTGEPALWMVFLAASVAICALVLPGVSGSFFLLVVGLYAPTMAAVDQRNFAYLGTFMLGALVGIVLFVRLLEWLLEHKHTVTLVAMAGLLLGSLRALWPWQDGDGTMLAAGDDWPKALGLFVLGAAIVGVVAWLQRRFSEQEPVR
ncbi:DUF368 domain-containing protein [Corynebacterium hansenii]|uniref:DUF368 domain-containing protein n=1 Tax=Corynebacterium hansenii TaxID=394964 RepID=A0ABV7ZM19_9CORY|nr:DUF368 domain-containing protein [Corynebacterium hansenii]WJZ00184.1 hypothetical protein CHAN_07870 [Corynebacterium hansenii]